MIPKRDDSGTRDAEACRSRRRVMRRTLIVTLTLAAIGGLSLYSQRNQQEAAAPTASEKAETQVLDTDSGEARFVLDPAPVDRGNTHQFTSYAPVLSKVTPAVVTVASSSMIRVMRNRYSSPMEDFLRRFYGIPSPEEEPSDRGAPEPEQRRVPNGLGSGVIVSPDGYILTNNHVITDSRGEPADEVSVTLPDGREFTADLVGRDPQTDVALLHIEANDLPFLPMANSDNLMVGDIVFAVGNPMGLSQTVTMGIVSATGRSRLGILGERGYENFIQTDASINPGNSGGALVDAEGRLVGINTAIFSRTGGNIGIGFAIPSTLAQGIITNLIESGTVQRGYLGVNISDLDPTLAESFGLKGAHGALVEGVQDDSPAAKAGLKRGDVVTSLNGRPIANVNELRVSIAQMKPGSEVKLGIVREEEEKEIDIVLGSLDEVGGVSGAAADNILPGVSLAPLNDELREQYNIEGQENGIVVTRVAGDSPLAEALSEGMLIMEINDRAVQSISDAREAVRPGAVNRLWVSFRGRQGYIGIRIPRE